MVSPVQINAQVPIGLSPDSNQSIPIYSNGRICVPQPLRLGTVNPGIGGVSLYQINCQLPESAPAGDLTLVSAQDKWQANSAKLLVARGGNFDPLLHEE